MNNISFKPICELGKVVTGKTPSTENESNFSTDFPFITPSDIHTFNEKKLCGTERGISLSAAKKMAKNILPADSVCFVCIGSTIGKMCMTTTNSFTNQQINTLIVNKKNNPHYIFYLLRYIKGYFQLLGSGTGSGKGIVNKSTFEKTKIPVVCDIDIQNRIADILSTYDDLIENNNRRIALLEKAAQELYKEWFVRFRFPGYENTEFENGIPKGWEYVKLGEKLRFERGVGYSSADLMDSHNVLLSMNNIRPWGGFIRDYSRKYSGKFKEFQVVKSNDLVMSITDMTQDRRIIGYVGLVPSSNQTRIICTHLMKVVALKNEYQNTFLYGLFNFSGLSRCISERATGANVLGLTANILNNVKWYLPNVDLISEYCSIVNPLYEAIEQYENQNENLIKQRDLLLPRLMSGKLEV